MKTMGVRLKQLRKAAGLSQEEVGKHCGRNAAKPVDKASVSAWESDKTRPSLDNLRALASLYERSLDFLVEGHENVDETLAMRAKVPLISWVEAGDGAEPVDPYNPGVAEEWIPCAEKHSGQTFALRVRGHSMTSDGFRSYPDGRIILCDPEMRGGATNGQRVIAKLDDGTLTFKEYVDEDGSRWLRALNKAWPPITKSFEIIAVVIGVHIPE